MPVNLPEAIAYVIAGELAPFPVAELREVAKSLSNGYRDRRNIRHTLSPIERAAYLAVRFPSTFAVAERVWSEVASLTDTSTLKSVLDVGAGPGTASLATIGYVAECQFTLLERDAGWREQALALSKAAGNGAQFVPGAIEQIAMSGAHDAVVACYALNELPVARLPEAVARLWQSAAKIMIVIEPGTPKGFEVVRAVRELVLADGGFAVAPCTHDLACPMSPQDWCHRPVRVPRSAAHRLIKRAELGYEDEKFSYVVMVRDAPARLSGGRIVRKPIHAKGHLHLDLCRDGALGRVTASKRQGEAFRRAKSLAWGDLWVDQID